MAPNPEKDHALSPVPGALTDYLKSMVELTNDNMPDVVVHEYCPLLDSSDMGERTKVNVEHSFLDDLRELNPQTSQ